MNRIVRESYPVANLPEDLRRVLADDIDSVRLVMEAVGAPARTGTPTPLEELFERSRPSYANFEEVVAHIEALRAELG